MTFKQDWEGDMEEAVIYNFLLDGLEFIPLWD